VLTNDPPVVPLPVGPSALGLVSSCSAVMLAPIWNISQWMKRDLAVRIDGLAIEARTCQSQRLVAAVEVAAAAAAAAGRCEVVSQRYLPSLAH
jgi:hypothetical protein